VFNGLHFLFLVPSFCQCFESLRMVCAVVLPAQTVVECLANVHGSVALQHFAGQYLLVVPIALLTESMNGHRVYFQIALSLEQKTAQGEWQSRDRIVLADRGNTERVNSHLSFKR
jgi:hypothetical protein